MWSTWWDPNNLPGALSNLESTFGVSIDDLIPLKRLSGNELRSSERILNILNKFNSETIKNGSDLLLLHSCGRVLLDESFLKRSELCDKVWKKLEECKINFSVNHYNIYLENCIDNRKQINFRTFLDSMGCNPNQDTLRRLLECSCENGDVKQAYDIFKEMQSKSYIVDNEPYNTLLLGYAANGGLIKAKEFLDEMRDANFHIEITYETHFNLLRGLALYNKEEEFFSSLEKLYIKLEVHNYFDLLLTLGSKGNQSWLTRVLEVSEPRNMPDLDIQKLIWLCKQLIYLDQSDSATFYYKLFVKPLDDSNGEYAFTLLEDMVFTKTHVEKIIMFIDDLKTYNLSTLFTLEKLTSVALMNVNTDEMAWKLMKANFTVLRPQNFCPILREFGQKQEEIGIFSTLKKMLEWEVRPDCETLEYCIPFCSTNNYPDLYSRMQISFGFLNHELFAPFLRVFLQQNDVSACLEMCRNNKVGGVMVDQFLQPLVTTWTCTENNENIAEILQYIGKMATKKLDYYYGKFLFKALQECLTLFNHQHLLSLLKVMESKNMSVSFISLQPFLHILKNSKHQYPLTEDIKKVIGQITHASIIDEVHIPLPHPPDMSHLELELCLIQLQRKKLETGGVLSQLIQYYCTLDNEERVKELRQQFQNSSYTETAEMKSSLMCFYIRKKNFVDAFNTYKDLKEFSANFMFDEFKIIDLAALLVKNNQFDAAIKILKDETRKRKVKGGKPLEENCLRLLESANDDLKKMQILFQFLLENGYCEVSNIVLRPLVKFYINRYDGDNLIKAVEIFKDCANKYKCTPQRLQLLCLVVKEQNKELIEEVYNCLVKVHGSKIALELYISALARNGSTELLRNELFKYESNLKHLVKITCERRIAPINNKLQELETLAEVACELPLTVIDTNCRIIIYQSILKLHSKNNDCESAVKFYRNLKENDEILSQSLLYDLLQLTIRCKYEMPVID